jgi:hypothetical protein
MGTHAPPAVVASRTHRVSYFATRHEESVREWVSKVTTEADPARFAPEKINRAVLAASGLLRPEVAEAVGGLTAHRVPMRVVG